MPMMLLLSSACLQQWTPYPIKTVTWQKAYVLIRGGPLHLPSVKERFSAPFLAMVNVKCTFVFLWEVIQSHVDFPGWVAPISPILHARLRQTKVHPGLCSSQRKPPTKVIHASGQWIPSLQLLNVRALLLHVCFCNAIKQGINTLYIW